MVIRATLLLGLAAAVTVTTLADTKDETRQRLESLRNGTSGKCHANVWLQWGAEVGGALYTTPVVLDINADGRKELVAPAFSQYIEVLDAATGQPLEGWPVMDNTLHTHSSITPCDVDRDGALELLYASEGGELIFFGAAGEQLKRLRLPYAPMAIDWHTKKVTKDAIHEEVEKEQKEMGARQDLIGMSDFSHYGKHAMLNTPPKASELGGWVKEFLLLLPHSFTEPLVRGVPIARMQSAFQELYNNTTDVQVRNKLKTTFRFLSKGGFKIKITLPDPQNTTADMKRFLVAIGEKGKVNLESHVSLDGMRLQFVLLKMALMSTKAQQFDKWDESVDYILANASIVHLAESFVPPMLISHPQATVVSGHGSLNESAAVAAELLLKHASTARADLPKVTLPHTEVHSQAEGNNGSAGARRLLEAEGEAEGESEGEYNEEMLSEEQVELQRRLGYETEYEGHEDEWQGEEAGLEYTDEARLAFGVLGDGPPDRPEYEPDEHIYLGGVEACEPDNGTLCVPPHILATPVLVDLEGDGSQELVIAVTYFFDMEGAAMGKVDLGEGIDGDLYLTSALVVIDPASNMLKWNVSLDSSARTGRLRANLLSSPTVIDVDGDGCVDIFQTSEYGYIYGFNCTGHARKGFPVFLGVMQGQVGVEDITGDGFPEICAADMSGVVACYTHLGQPIWTALMFGGAIHGILFGDVNGDGRLDVVVGTSVGLQGIWVFDGPTGKHLPHFPMLVGAINSPILLVNLNDTRDDGGVMLPMPLTRRPDTRNGPAPTGPMGLHLIVPANGKLLVVDGVIGCADVIDLGEHSYSQVLADDLQGNGYIDLIVSTISGTVYSLQTSTKFHPSKVWNAPLHGMNGMTAIEGRTGVWFLPQTRKRRNVVGARMKVFIEISDPQHPMGRTKGRYLIQLFAGRGVMLFNKTYTTPQRFIEIVPTPREPLRTTLTVRMTTERHQVFEDTIVLNFNTAYYETIQWILLVPFFVLCAALVLNRANEWARGGDQYESLAE